MILCLIDKCVPVRFEQRDIVWVGEWVGEVVVMVFVLVDKVCVIESR